MLLPVPGNISPSNPLHIPAVPLQGHPKSGAGPRPTSRGELSTLALLEAESIAPCALFGFSHLTPFLCFTSCDKFAVPGLWKAAGRVSCRHCFSPLYHSAGLDPFKSPFLFFIFFIFSVQLPTISAFCLSRGLKSVFPLPYAPSCSNPSCAMALFSTGTRSSAVNSTVESC